jgi:hypothetical protein
MAQTLTEWLNGEVKQLQKKCLLGNYLIHFF